MLKKRSCVQDVRRLESTDLRVVAGGFGAGQSSDGASSPPPPPPNPAG
jgi:hypothetical protein